MYPKIYYQLKGLIEICENNRKNAKDKAYMDMLIEEFESACLQIECEHIDDEYAEPEELGSDESDIANIMAI